MMSRTLVLTALGLLLGACAVAPSEVPCPAGGIDLPCGMWSGHGSFCAANCPYPAECRFTARAIWQGDCCDQFFPAGNTFFDCRCEGHEVVCGPNGGAPIRSGCEGCRPPPVDAAVDPLDASPDDAALDAPD